MASEDLARAIAFLWENQTELSITMKGYSLWGGSAGARMATWVSIYGTQTFQEKQYPRPAAVIVQYTGLSEVTGQEVPTFATVGTEDWIAHVDVMQRRIHQIRKNGTAADIRIFKGLGHGFGLGEDTVAEGWIDEAYEFWRKNRNV